MSLALSINSADQKPRMRLQQYILAMLTAVATAGNCPPSAGFKLSIDTGRNGTGHWIVAVEASREDHKAAEGGRGNPKAMTILIEQQTSDCAAMEVTTLTATANLGLPVPKMTNPPAGYDQVNSLGYYRAYHVPKTWEEARVTCENDGAHLIIIDSDDETTVVKTLFDSRPPVRNYTNAEYFSIGVHDQHKEGEFVTVLGKPLSSVGYTNWKAGQPDGSTAQNCVHVNVNTYWYDDPCSHKAPFICEYNA